MEYLDYYDENGNYLGYKSRDEVHSKGLWHNTIQCWLYDELGNIYFQIRTETNTFYTTASGHVLKGESIQDAFKREVYEEIGLTMEESDATFVKVIVWKMDKVKEDGSMMIDRAKANVYVDLYKGDCKDFHFDLNEVLGIVRVNAKDALRLFKNEIKEIDALIIDKDLNQISKKVTIDDFLITENETQLSKYGSILEKVIALTN